jgi:hypothetical protein
MSLGRGHSALLIPTQNHKIDELLPQRDTISEFEASGICIENNYFVIFDSLLEVAHIKEFSNRSPINRLIDTAGFNNDYEGYEDITFNRNTGEFYLLIESQQDRRDGVWKSRIIQCDPALSRIEHRPEWVDPRITVEGDHHNKGLEGLAWVHRKETDFLLLLHEKTGSVYVCRQGIDQWYCEEQFSLPRSVQFNDYSSLDIQENKIAVVSQESAELWVGQLDDSSWRFVDEGKVYEFPDNYCNIEGVAWINDSRIVTCSDKAKKKQRDDCRKFDQSIHFFNLPPV